MITMMRTTTTTTTKKRLSSEDSMPTILTPTKRKMRKTSMTYQRGREVVPNLEDASHQELIDQSQQEGHHQPDMMMKMTLKRTTMNHHHVEPPLRVAPADVVVLLMTTMNLLAEVLIETHEGGQLDEDHRLAEAEGTWYLTQINPPPSQGVSLLFVILYQIQILFARPLCRPFQPHGSQHHGCQTISIAILRASLHLNLNK
mmetsp:Transcript_38929/g.54821  ORF Transcript_38929/g.54821 Transcript_38929/m.54821 type:complete len:201 (+) Transcript_38929:376-978(+)